MASTSNRWLCQLFRQSFKLALFIFACFESKLWISSPGSDGFFLPGIAACQQHIYFFRWLLFVFNVVVDLLQMLHCCSWKTHHFQRGPFQTFADGCTIFHVKITLTCERKRAKVRRFRIKFYHIFSRSNTFFIVSPHIISNFPFLHGIALLLNLEISMNSTDNNQIPMYHGHVGMWWRDKILT